MTYRPIKDRIHALSLGARIVWVFVFTALFSTFIFASAFKLLTNDDEKHRLPTIVANYANSLIKELGEPAQLANAKKITQRTGINVYIQTATQQISTSDTPLTAHLFDEYLMVNHQNLLFKIKWQPGKIFIQATKPSETITFELSFRHSPIEVGFVFASVILLIILVIYIAYRLVRYLISPIQDIKQGVAEFAQGHLNYRIEKKRNDDLGGLTEQINQMASQLDSILQAKQQLLIAISHELRTPMTRMKIALDLPFNDKNKTRFNDSLNQMEKLLAELLETEKLSTQHQTLQFQNESINELIRHLIAEEYSNNKIQLNLTANHSHANIDTMRIRLLLRNLLGNAIKYGQDKPITIKTTEEGAYIAITVSDDGEGISEANINHVFEPYYREDQSRQRQTGGTGMGLYLVKLIVDAHHGNISINSKKGQGTQVKVCLKQAISSTP